MIVAVKSVKGRRPLFVAVLVSLLAFSIRVQAADAPLEAARLAVSACVEALWDGRAFDPELRDRETSPGNLLQRGVADVSDIEAMLADATLAAMNRDRTTRYVLRTMPERFNELFAPVLEWETYRKIIWRAAGTAVPDGRQMVISVGTLAPSGTPWISVPEKFVSVLEGLSDNKYSIRIFSGGVMGEDTDILRKMDVGQLDGCGCTALGILNASPEAAVFLAPGLFRNYDEIDYILERFRQRMDASFEKRGYILAALIDSGQFHFFSKNRIANLADIRRSKVLTWFGAIETTLFDELGISAMPVSVTEVVSALSTGMADTNLAPAAWMLGMQAYQYARYFVKEPVLYSPGAVFVSTRTRERLQTQFGMSDVFSHNVQELLVFELSSLESEWKDLLRRYEARCMEAFTARVGMKAVSLSPADRKTLEQAGRNVWTRLAGQAYPEDLLDDILAALDEYRRERK